MQLKLVKENAKQNVSLGLGDLSVRLRNYAKAKEYYEKALAISVEIGDRKEEASIYLALGNLCIDIDEYVKAVEYLENALSIAKEGVKDFECGDFLACEHCKGKETTGQETGSISLFVSSYSKMRRMPRLSQRQ